MNNNAITVNNIPLLFLCDQKKCARCCFPTCAFTRDIKHALHKNNELTFKEYGGSYWEDAKLAEIFNDRHERKAESDH